MVRIAFLEHWHIFFDSKPIQAKFLFDSKSLRTASSQICEYFIEIVLSLPELIGYQIEQTIVKCVVSEYNGSNRTQNIIIVADEFIAAFAWLLECW